MKLIILAVLLAGCSSYQDVQKKIINEVPISKESKMSLNKIWPLKNTGEFLQYIDVNTNNQRHAFSIFLNINSNRINAIAIHDIQGKIYDMELTNNGLSWSSIPEVSDKLKPEYILADFLMTYLPLSVLEKSLTDVRVEETKKESKRIRIFKKDDHIIREITTSHFKKGFFEDIQINNPEFGYNLKIQTVNQ